MSAMHVASSDDSVSPTDAPSRGTGWGSVLSMALGVVVLIASEFMPTSLLTPLAHDLGLSLGTAGQAISISGFFAVLTSLLNTPLTGRYDRKPVLLGFTLLLIVSGLIVALAANGVTFMAGRALLGIAIGGFWSMSTATVMRLVPRQSVAKALALINGGNALAATVAAPLGSYLGQYLGWRTVFALVLPLAVGAFIWQWRALPAMPNVAPVAIRNPFGLLRRAPVALGMTAILMLFMGQFALFTYLRPFLEEVTGISVTALSLVLLLVGATGLVGTYAIGALLERHLFTVLIAIPLAMAVIALALVATATSAPAVALLLGVWGLVATPAPVAWGLWLSKTLPRDAELGGGLMVATIQLAITMGAGLGGALFDSVGWWSPFALAGGLLVGSAGAAIAARGAPAGHVVIAPRPHFGRT